jgi:hypothetical protein
LVAETKWHVDVAYAFGGLLGVRGRVRIGMRAGIRVA